MINFNQIFLSSDMSMAINDELNKCYEQLKGVDISDMTTDQLLQYGELGDIGLQKRDALEELEAIKHSATHARARAQKARERAQEQEARNIQAQADSRHVKREYEAQKDNLQAVKAKYKHLQKQVEQVKGFLTIAEQRQLEELQRQLEQDWDEPERD